MILLDTEKIIALGTGGVSQLKDEYAITFYVAIEIQDKNLAYRLDSTSAQLTYLEKQECPSWDDFSV